MQPPDSAFADGTEALRLAEEAAGHLIGPDQAVWLNRLEQSWPALRQALIDCEREPALTEAGLRLCAALSPFWWMRGRASEGRSWCQQFLARAGGNAQLRASVLESAGTLAYALAEFAQARDWYWEALQLHRKLGNVNGQATVLNQLGMAAREQGQHAEALRVHGESVALYRTLGDEWGEAHCLNNIGVVAFLAGDLETAEQHHRQSLTLRRKLGDERGVASSLSNLGHIARRQGDPEQAEVLYRESLAIRQHLSDRWGEAASWLSLGLTSCDRGRTGEARPRLQRSLELFRQVRDCVGLCECLEGFAVLAAREGNWVDAVRLGTAAEVWRQELHAPLVPWKKTESQAIEDQARAHLSPQRFGAAKKEGAELRQEQAFDLAQQV